MKKAILISCFNWYKTRLYPIRDILISRGFDVTVLESDFHHIKKAPITTRFPEVTYIHVPPYKSNMSAARIRSHISFSNSVGRVIEQIKPELIYCLLPPNYTAKICMSYITRHPETKLMLDIIDLWPESMPFAKLNKTPPAKVWKNWRNARDDPRVYS